MKKKLTRLWGVGLIIVLLSTLFIAATPASAQDPLQWNMYVSTPTWAVFEQLEPGSDILDIAVGGDGATVYAVGTQAAVAAPPMPPPGIPASPAKVYKSENGGVWWSDITANLAGAVTATNFVAVAPDNPDIVVVADASPGACFAEISMDGGASFVQLGNIADAAGNPAANIYDVAISPLTATGIRYVACPGDDVVTIPDPTTAAVYYYNLGAAAPVWRNAVTDFWNAPPPPAVGSNLVVTGEDRFIAFAFSPNFAGDYMAVALSADDFADGDGFVDAVGLHVLSFNSWAWNSQLFAGTAYPRNVVTAAVDNALVVGKGSLSLSPDYVGGDEVLRVAFAGLAALDVSLPAAQQEIGGIFRHDDDAAPRVLLGGTTPAGSGVGINSVAFNGTNLIAGEFWTNNVYRSADPMTTMPTVLPARSLKRIGVNDAGNPPATPDITGDQVVVDWIGEQAVGIKQMDGSCFSVSADAGMTWNDVSLMDSLVGVISDIYVADDDSAFYIAASDWGTINDILTGNPEGEVSIYRIAGFSTQRVLCVPMTAINTPNLLLRGVPGDPNVIYAADTVGTTMYYTADGGVTRWYARSMPGNAGDLAAGSEDVCYVALAGTPNLVKSINAGFTWSLPIPLDNLTGNIYSMYSIDDESVIIGSTAGSVCWTNDGADTFTYALPFNIFAVNVIVAGDGVEPGDHIYAAEGGNNALWRAEVNPMMTQFVSMNQPAATTAEVNTGLALVENAFYSLSVDAAIPASYLDHTLVPTKAELAPRDWSTQVVPGPTLPPVQMNTPPTALKVSTTATGSIKLYAIDAGAFGPGIYYFEDNVAFTGPTLIGPSDGALIQMNVAMGIAPTLSFSWNRVSKARDYTIDIALDPDFSELIVNRAIVFGGVGSTADPVNWLQVGGILLPLLEPGTTYYWRIQAINPIYSAFSETRSFTIQPGAAAVPDIGSPENGGTIAADAVAAFSWTPVAGTTMYEFQLAEDPGFAAPLYSESLAETGIQPAVTLESGKTYFWRVRALEPVEGDWSTIANFTVAMPEPPPVAPEITVPEIKVPEITIPEIVVPEPKVVVEEAPEEPAISEGLLLAIIIIGAILVIAVIVLIVRTRRQV